MSHPSNPTDPTLEPPAELFDDAIEADLAAAYQDLTVRSRHVDVSAGPHRASAGPGTRHNVRRLVPAVALAVTVAVGAWGVTQALPSDTTETDTVDAPEGGTTDANGTDGDGTVSESGGDNDPDDGGVGVLASTEIGPEPSEPFLLVTSDPAVPDSERVTEAGFPALAGSWTDILGPDEVVDAAPDGAGGVIWVSADAVWHQPAGGDPVRLRWTPDSSPRVVGTRLLDGRATVLVVTDGELVGYRSDGAEVSLGIPGSLIDAAITDDGVVGVFGPASRPDDDPADSGGGGGGVWIGRVDLDGGDIDILVEPVPADEAAAPRLVAVTGDRLVVLDGEQIVVRRLADGERLDAFESPAPVEDVSTMEAANGSLLVAFGEAALLVDLDNPSQRSVIDTGVAGDWVLGAHWADPPESDEADRATVGDEGERLRVDTEVVAADRADPFLNVRLGAGADEKLVAKLPPTYRGLGATGAATTTDDGAQWIEVELLHPVAYSGPSLAPSANPTGWVNAALTVPLTGGGGVGTDEVPACVDNPGTISGVPSEGVSGDRNGYVYGLETDQLTERCLRVVLTVAAGEAPFVWSDVPASAGPAGRAPSVAETTAGSAGAVFELGALTTAWPAATQTADGVYVVRADSGGLDLVTTSPVSRTWITPRPDDGLVVIDLSVDGPPTVPANDLVTLTGEPLVFPGSVTVTGLARPFEANLETRIEDASGRPVEAVFSSSVSLGTRRTAEYGVQTTDWTEAWGRFALRVEDLAPGDYSLVLVPDGGADTSTRSLRVPITIESASTIDVEVPGDDEQAAVRALVDFARGGPIDDVPLADEVVLSVGPARQETRTAGELADRSNWTFDPDEVFAGFVGPFSALEPLATGPERFTAGEIPQCAGPPRTWPAEWAGLRQINVEPVGVDSCIDWYGVSVFLDGDGRIAVVVLDLFGP